MPGVVVEALAKGSGLRSASWHVLASTKQTAFTETAVISTTAAFVQVAVARRYVGSAQTPVVMIWQPAPGYFSIRLRIAGYDMAGNYQVETSPVIGVMAKTNNFVYFSRVFSEVTECSYAEVTPTAGAEIRFGVSADPKKTVDANNAHYAPRNHGYGVPLHLPENPGYTTLVAAHGAEVATALDACKNVSMLNRTTFKEWRALPGGIETGANVAGWPGTNDKIAIVDWTKIIDGETGAAAVWSAGDCIAYMFHVRMKV